MSPKRIIFVATGIFAGIGILVSVVIIAINGGFSGEVPFYIQSPNIKRPVDTR